jgi:hypothetical protein
VTVHVLLANHPLDAAKAKADLNGALQAAGAFASKRLHVSP